MSTYLKRYYLDDRKLAQRALLEFHRALQSERMIAFTGAMTTESFGYPNWMGLIIKFKAKAADIFAACPKGGDCAICKRYFGEPINLVGVADRIDKFFYGKLDKRVGLSLIGELAEHLDKAHCGLESEGALRIDLLHSALAELTQKPGPAVDKNDDEKVDCIEAL